MIVTVVFPDPDAAAAMLAQLTEGVEGIQQARAAAAADITEADNLRAAAGTHRAAAAAQRAQVTAFTPAATYRASEMTAVRDQLAAVLQRQELILTALADMYAYRAAVDRNAVTTDDALLWLARLASGTLTDPNGA